MGKSLLQIMHSGMECVLELRIRGSCTTLDLPVTFEKTKTC